MEDHLTLLCLKFCFFLNLFQTFAGLENRENSDYSLQLLRSPFVKHTSLDQFISGIYIHQALLSLESSPLLLLSITTTTTTIVIINDHLVPLFPLKAPFFSAAYQSM